MSKNDLKEVREHAKSQLLLTDGHYTAEELIDWSVSTHKRATVSAVVAVFYAEQARYEGLTPFEYLCDVVSAKFKAYAEGDKGARGDAVELITRYAVKHGFIRYEDVRVKTLSEIDISSKKLNVSIEVGHNGKSFLQAAIAGTPKEEITAEQLMFGYYDVLIYGSLGQHFTANDLLKNEFLDHMFVFENKYEFPQAIAGRKGIASGWNVSHERATVQYNSSLAGRFEEYCKVNHIPTLREWLDK